MSVVARKQGRAAPLSRSRKPPQGGGAADTSSATSGYSSTRASAPDAHPLQGRARHGARPPRTSGRDHAWGRGPRERSGEGRVMLWFGAASHRLDLSVGNAGGFGAGLTTSFEKIGEKSTRAVLGAHVKARLADDPNSWPLPPRVVHRLPTPRCRPISGRLRSRAARTMSASRFDRLKGEFSSSPRPTGRNDPAARSRPAARRFQTMRTGG
jgi:hypothetical protein